MKSRYLFILLACLFVVPFQTEAQRMEGMASFYADRFDGQLTSTGETFRQDGFMAASMEFDYGTILEVTNVANGKTVEVRINDCGPHAKNRVIDLSRAAAARLDFIKEGEAKVKLRVIVPSEAGPTCARGAWSRKLKAEGKKPKAPPVAPPLNQGQSAAASVVPAAAGGAPPMEGLASYYADRYHGRPTSTGETYDKNALTAASKSFPYGTIVEVTNTVNGRKVQVRINDCGPSTDARIIDLSRAASDRIDLTRAGVSMVQLRIVTMGNDGPTCNRAAWIKELKAKGAEPEPEPEEEEFIALPIGNPGVAPPPPTVAPATAAPTPEPAPTVAPPPPPAPVADEVPTTYGTALPAVPEQEFDDTDILFGVQVGAFGKAVNAEALKDELKEKGFVHVWSAKVGNVYRVFTGKFYFQNQAEDYKQKVREAGYNGATTRRIQ